MYDKVRSYSKAEQLKCHQKEKDTPKFKDLLYPKKKKKMKKPYVSHGVQIPSRAKRGEFTLAIKHQIIDMWGNTCRYCGAYTVEFHHRKFRSGIGRNNPRNGCPLCTTCHARCHEEHEFAQKWRDEAREMWGQYYFWDKYDLWKHGMIERPTDELMEKFFEGERENAKRVDEVAETRD